jgi:peptidoglycan/xylan/chitin deacetylase (PgdA/CDA1 family)
MTVIPILLYHTVTAQPECWIAPYAVTPNEFRHHVALIVSSGRTAMTVSEVAAALRGLRPLPPRPLVLTFDDGFADFADAASKLVAHKLCCTLYVTTGALRGRPNAADLRIPPARMLDWSQLGELVQQGVEIGGHTHTHPQLDTLPKPLAAKEIRQCKELIEDALSREVASFAYPHGFHTDSLRRAVQAAGYTSASAVMNALSSSSDNLFSLARLTIGAATTRQQLADWLAGNGAPVAPFPESWRTKAWRAYRRIRGNRSSSGVIAN